MDNLLKSKTFWTGVTGLIAAAAGYFTGEMNGSVAIQTAIASLLGIFIRAGISKQINNAAGVASPAKGDGGFAAVRLLTCLTGLLLVGGLLTVFGCASLTGQKETPQSIAAKGLLSARQGVIASAVTADTLCAQGIMKQDDCNQARKIYNDAQPVYTAAADSFLLYISTKDEAARQNYTAMLTRLNAFFSDIGALINKYGTPQTAGGVK